MNAEEARLTAAHAQQKYEESMNIELDKILGRIEKAANERKKSISEGSLDGYITKKLKDLGYKVTTGSQYNESYTFIEW